MDGGSPRLRGFLDSLAPGASILELGCGGGREAEAMIAAGFIVDATDGVVALAREAEARIDQPVRVMRFDELDAETIYDAVWANACLLHIPWPTLPGILACIHRALKPGGWHCASYKIGDGEGRDGFGRYFSYPSRAALANAYRRSAPWASIATEAHQGSGYDGRPTPWATVTTRR